jgi:hypothetical protein
MAILIAKNSAKVWNNKKLLKLKDTNKMDTTRGTAHEDREKYDLLSVSASFKADINSLPT